MLDEFIVANREEMIRRCRAKVAARTVSTSSKAEVAASPYFSINWSRPCATPGVRRRTLREARFNTGANCC
jgi:hypothetical protein